MGQPYDQRKPNQGLIGSTWVRRNNGAASGETMNLIIARAASGSLEAVNKPTFDWQGLFKEPGNGPT